MPTAAPIGQPGLPAEELASFTAAYVTFYVLAAPMMGAALVVGLLVSVFQALTQINEQTLTFVPKILAVFAALLVAGPWLLNSLVGYTSGLFAMLPSMVR